MLEDTNELEYSSKLLSFYPFHKLLDYNSMNSCTSLDGSWNSLFSSSAPPPPGKVAEQRLQHLFCAGIFLNKRVNKTIE